MATKVFRGTATAVAQVSTVQITADDNATSYRVTIGGVTVSVMGSGTGVNDTAAALQAALAASTHPYFTAITWTVATDTVTGTALIAGCPFVAASSVSGGTGTIGAVATPTASAGPNHLDTADNWSSGTVPANSDVLIFPQGCPNVCWGLDLTSLTGVEVLIEEGAGNIGLDSDQFATNAAATSYSSTRKTEYREDYLKSPFASVVIGQPVTNAVSWTSARVKVENTITTASTIEVVSGPTSSADDPKPAVQLLAADADVDVYVRAGPGGVGLGVDVPGETGTFGDVVITSESGSTKVSSGGGVTLTSWKQRGGTNAIKPAGTITTVQVDGGALTVEGDQAVTTLEVNGGTCYANHDASGADIVTANLNGGTLDMTAQGAAQTVTTVNMEPGATFKWDPESVTVTTFNEASEAGVRTLVAS